MFGAKNSFLFFVFSQTDTSITHKIPARICDLKNLTVLDVSNNYIPGEFPDILNCSKLEYLLLLQNYFVGPIPADIDRLSRLRYLDLTANNFSGDIPPAIGRLRELFYLFLVQNEFNGTWPTEIESFNNLSSLELLDLSLNKLEGTIPGGMLTLKNLNYLHLFINRLSGHIPSSIEALNLKQIDLSDNHLTGSIPAGFGKLQNLTGLNLFWNQLSGEIPANISLIPTLGTFKVSENKLSGELPQHLCARGALLGVVASNNNLSGEVPTSLGNCTSLLTIQLSNNRFSGGIPSGIWTSLDMFYGPIPAEISSWMNISASNNLFSGEIPVELTSLPSIYILWLDGNQLSGQLPHDIWEYENSFLNNSNLCANIEILKSCYSKASNSKLSTNYLVMIISFTLTASLVIVFLIFSMVQKYQRWDQGSNVETWKMTSFQKFDFTESNILSSLAQNSLIGSGGSGKVYRTIINHSGEVVAVKWISNNRQLGQNLEKQFVAEVQILASDIILDWPMRLQIAIGAARGLCYMHHDFSPPIIHRDVKSSNILLDSEFNTKIADFGLAKMLAKQEEDPETMSVVVGTFGYIAPEYAYTRKANKKIDVYSFGVVLLELATGREANRGNEHMNLAQWAWQHFGEGKSIVEALDEEIMEECFMEEMITVFKLGLMCTSKAPSDRPSMREEHFHLVFLVFLLFTLLSLSIFCWVLLSYSLYSVRTLVPMFSLSNGSEYGLPFSSF
ncbi:unnamed protein product, partial [Vitis vinifera]